MIEPNLLARLCAVPDRMLGLTPRGSSASGPIGFLIRWLSSALVADEHPRVRLQAVVACTYIPNAESLQVALTAVDFTTDRFLDYALTQAVFALKRHWLPAFKAGQLNLGSKPQRLEFLVRADNTLTPCKLSVICSNPTPSARGRPRKCLAYSDRNG